MLYSMKKYRFLITLLLSITAQASLCNHTTDSLKNIISNASDEQKGKAMVELYLTYYKINEIDSSLAVIDDLIEFRQQQDSTMLEANARWSRIALLNNSARFIELAEDAEKQMIWFKEHKLWDRYYQIWQRKCSALHDQGKVQTSLREAKIMKEDAEQRDDDIGRAMAYKQMGVVYYDLHQFDQAGDAFKRSIHYLLKEGNTTGMISGLYDFQCKVFDRQQKYQEEKDSTDKWLKHLDLLSKINGANLVNGPYCSAWVTRATAFMGMGQIDSMIYSLNKAEEYYNSYPTSLCKYYLYILHARLCMEQGDPQKTLAYTDSLEGILEGPTDARLVLRAKALMALGRFEEAVPLYQQLYERKDSIYSKDMRMQLDELNTLFRVDELKMQNELDHQRSIIGAIALALFAIIWIVFNHHRANKKLRREHSLLIDSNNKLEQSYKELTEANARAEESSRMKTNFIHQISHEIRTPLNVLSGFTQIITTPGIQLDDSTKSDISKRITENTERITGLVKKMLELSEANSQAIIACEDNVTAVQIAIQATQESGIEMAGHLNFNLQIDPELENFSFRTNVKQATRALSLLLDNAQKFTKEGSVRLVVSRIQDKATIQFSVEDTGIGIPENEAEHIFDEFVQLDDYYVGTGIGLTIARSIVRRMGGDIKLDTDYKEGARFLMTIPTTKQ